VITSAKIALVRKHRDAESLGNPPTAHSKASAVSSLSSTGPLPDLPSADCRAQREGEFTAGYLAHARENEKLQAEFEPIVFETLV
jgi:hypothetical protein